MNMPSIEKRLDALEKRLATIEHLLSIRHAAPSQEKSPSSSSITDTEPALTATGKPGNWLGKIAILCFVLAAGFMIKLSVDSGWLTPARQIGLAALFGCSLIGAGMALLRTDISYAGLLPGGGIIILYLTIFAAHRYHGLISFESALAFTCLISALCVWLYRRIKHDIYALTATVGAYLSPILLGSATFSSFSLYYFLLCSLAFAALSFWVQSRTVTIISAYLALFISAFVGMSLQQDILITFVLALHFLIFAIGTYLYTLRTHQPLSIKEAWSFLPVLLLFYAAEYYFIDRTLPHAAPWVSLSFAGLLLLLYLSVKKRFFAEALGSQFLILTFMTLVFFHSVYLELLPLDARPWLFTFIMLGIAFCPQKEILKQQRSTFLVPLFAVLAILVIEYIAMLFHLLSGETSLWTFASFAAFASLWLVLLTPYETMLDREKYSYLFLSAAHGLAILGFYQLTHAHGSLAVSASWLSYAAIVITLAFVRKDTAMAKSAVFVLSLAAGKALLYDASSAPTMVRILCLLLTGAVLYGSGFLLRRITRWASH